MKEKYTLNFVIPQGPTGPQGKEHGLSAYGGRFVDCDTSLNLVKDERTRIPLEQYFFEKNMDYTEEGVASALLEGIYEIHYVVTITSLVDTRLSVAVGVDSVYFAYSSKTLKAGESYLFSGLLLKDISVNDVVELTITSIEDGEVVVEQDSCFTLKCLN